MFSLCPPQTRGLRPSSEPYAVTVNRSAHVCTKRIMMNARPLEGALTRGSVLMNTSSDMDKKQNHSAQNGRHKLTKQHSSKLSPGFVNTTKNIRCTQPASTQMSGWKNSFPCRPFTSSGQGHTLLATQKLTHCEHLLPLVWCIS